MLCQGWKHATVVCRRDAVCLAVVYQTARPRLKNKCSCHTALLVPCSDLVRAPDAPSRASNGSQVCGDRLSLMYVYKVDGKGSCLSCAARQVGRQVLGTRLNDHAGTA